MRHPPLGEPASRLCQDNSRILTVLICTDSISYKLKNPRFCLGFFAPRARLELATLRLTAECSTIELSRNIKFFFSNLVRLTAAPIHRGSYRGIYFFSPPSNSVNVNCVPNWSPKITLYTLFVKLINTLFNLI